MILVLDVGLGVATFLFVAAFVLAKRGRQPLHQFVAGAAVIVTLIIGVGLIVFVRFVHEGNYATSGISVALWATPWMVFAHRALATVAFVGMLVLAYLGFKRKAAVHKRFAPYFLALYIIVYVSGFFIFQTAP